MNSLETQKLEAEALLYDSEDEEEKRAAIEAEIRKFEAWTTKVKPYLTDPEYTPTYEELRLAVRILGLNVTVYPQHGDWPYRYRMIGHEKPPCLYQQQKCQGYEGWEPTSV